MSLTGRVLWRRSRVLVSVPTPAAGADWSVAVPSGQAWRLMACTCQLVTSATAATRTIAFGVSIGGTTVYQRATGSTQTAGVTRVWMPVPGAQMNGSSPMFDVSVPDIWVGPGGAFYAATSLRQAGDQWSAIRLYVEIATYRPGSVHGQRAVDGIVEIVGAMPAALGGAP